MHNNHNKIKFNPFIASHGRLSRSAVPRVSGRSGDLHFHAQNGSNSFRSPAFSRSKRLKLVPEPHIFKLKPAQTCSGAPHFHARPGARSRALAHISLCRGTYLPKSGGSGPWTPAVRDFGFRAREVRACVHIFCAPPPPTPQVKILDPSLATIRPTGCRQCGRIARPEKVDIHVHILLYYNS